MSWDDFKRSQGATLAPDGVPLYFSDLKVEYHAALNNAVLMDRSHEGRIEGRGRSRVDLIQRISTNDLLNLSEGEGRPTLFTNANGRILDRIMVYNRGESVIITTEPGRGSAVRSYLQKQIFFNDDFQMNDRGDSTKQFALHGPLVNQFVKPPVETREIWQSFSREVAGYPVLFLQRKPLSGDHWTVIVPNEAGEAVWTALIEAGKDVGLIPAGSLTYNTLRIHAGKPGAGHELTTDYIPLEVGLWDEVSFSKGCYTGQEIIARMESRNRLAKTLVKLRLSQLVETPANLYHAGKPAGTLTSSVTTPDGEILGLGFVKTALADTEQHLTAGESQTEVSIIELAGVQPPREVAAPSE